MPITDLRKTNEISDLCHKSQEPVFITKNGYGDLVVMSIEAYEKLVRDIQVDEMCIRDSVVGVRITAVTIIST